MSCSTCNNKNCNNSTKCGCTDSYLTSPLPCPTPVDCPEAQPCSETFDSQCIIYTGDKIICDATIVVNPDVTVELALNNIVNYFCNEIANIPVVIVAAGDGIEVVPTVVGVTTTYTVSTESPVLKKFIYENTLPSGDPDQQIVILNTVYSPCNLPTLGCDGTLTTLPTVVDLIIQGYWFNVDLNYWIEFTHLDKTDTHIDASGNVSITPFLDPPPLNLILPVRIRITIIG
jgi:hypothetical protein